MARPNQEAIDTFIGITGASEAIAVQKLEEHGGDLNAAVNSHFSEGDRNVVNETSVATQQDDLMDIDDPIQVPTRRNHLSPLLEASMVNPFSLLDPRIRRSVLNGGSLFTDDARIVSQPREVREIPVEVKDSGHEPSRSGHAPIIEDVTETGQEQGPGIHGTVIIADEDGDDISDGPIGGAAQSNQPGTSVPADSSHEARIRPSDPVFDDFPEYSNNDIEEEMIQAAIEASKQEAQQSGDPGPQQSHSHLEDAELAHAVSLSLKGKVGASEAESSEPSEVELRKIVASNGRLGTGSSSAQDEGSNAEEQPLVGHRSRCASSSSLESAKEFGVDDASPPSSPVRNEIGSHLQHNGSTFPSDEWGGISSEEHDEAVMLEAAMFGGLPEGTGYRFPYAPHQFMQQGDPYTRHVPRPPSPSLQAQRFIREQQDDEYLASLAADREKEMKAKEEAEARDLQDKAAREAALEEERRKEEEARRKLEEEKELERQLAAKEASLPLEPAADDENAITLLVRMPDGARRGRRFLKSNSLQSLFDFMDLGGAVKPGTYRLVRPYPRRAFTDGDSALTLNELGLTSKQEALFLELI